MSKNKKIIIAVGLLVIILASVLLMLNNREEPPRPELPVTDYKSPIDFEKLWKENTDVVAYLKIPVLDIEYPILHKKGENEYYMHRNIKEQYEFHGELFIQDYNQDDFSDPINIIYGHNMNNGSYFGKLQEHYSSEDRLNENPDIFLYLPDREIKYEVMAAVPYSNMHILHYYNFDRPRMTESFIESVYSKRSINSAFSKNGKLTDSEPILVLSTCLSGGGDKRYLVVAQEVQNSFEGGI